MRLVAAKKIELWFSIALIAIGIIAFRINVPRAPTDTIGFAIVVMFAWVFALNAVLDIRRMNWPIKVLAVIWFVFVSCVTLQTLIEQFTFDQRWSLK